MRAHIGLLITVGEDGHEEEEIAFDSYAMSTKAGDMSLVKIIFANGLVLSGEDDGEDIPIEEIVLRHEAFVSFAVSPIPTVTIPKAEYDSLKEAADILGDSKTVEDIRQSIIEMVTEIITKQKAAADEASIPAADVEADKPAPQRPFGTENLIISRDNQ